MTSDGLTEEGVRRYLRRNDLGIRVYDIVDSTNTLLKELAAGGAPSPLAVISGEQTAGRGRMGRSFFSPADTGLYMSLLLRPALSPAEAVMLTACAAVAAAETIEEVSHRPAGIKWVNDIFVGGRKVCGILTEAETDPSSGLVRHVIIGVGINVYAPEGGFPGELRETAGALFPRRTGADERCRIAAGILERITELARSPGDPAVFEAYRSRSFLPGRQILLSVPGEPPQSAAVVDIGRDYSLRIRLPYGTERSVLSGEVRIRPLEQST